NSLFFTGLYGCYLLKYLFIVSICIFQPVIITDFILEDFIFRQLIEKNAHGIFKINEIWQVFGVDVLKDEFGIDIFWSITQYLRDVFMHKFHLYGRTVKDVEIIVADV